MCGKISQKEVFRQHISTYRRKEVIRRKKEKVLFFLFAKAKINFYFDSRLNLLSN